jgi:hypothetical protein
VLADDYAIHGGLGLDPADVRAIGVGCGGGDRAGRRWRGKTAGQRAAEAGDVRSAEFLAPQAEGAKFGGLEIISEAIVRKEVKGGLQGKSPVKGA